MKPEVHKPAFAIIGTAGRSNKELLSPKLWAAMKENAQSNIQDLGVNHLVSGGAAWADHLAVWAFNNALCSSLTLCLPAPFDVNSQRFVQKKPFEKSAANASNYYHEMFTKQINENTLAQLAQAIERGATVIAEPHSLGYGALFARNKKVANLSNLGVLAYSFCEGDTPSSSGTLSTWKQINSEMKIHVNLFDFI